VDKKNNNNHKSYCMISSSKGLTEKPIGLRVELLKQL